MKEEHDDGEHPIVTQTRVPPEGTESGPDTESESDAGGQPIVTQTRVP